MITQGILTYDLKLDDIAVAVAFDVTGDAGVISGLGPIHLSEYQIGWLNQHAVLRVILNHVSLKQCAIAIRSRSAASLYRLGYYFQF